MRLQADAGDTYRDGVREGGQVRGSTANVERIEILKGPSSVLYGRSAGGGVINLISILALRRHARCAAQPLGQRELPVLNGGGRHPANTHGSAHANSASSLLFNAARAAPVAGNRCT
jgi:hypothetical protein